MDVGDGGLNGERGFLGQRDASVVAVGIRTRTCTWMDELVRDGRCTIWYIKSSLQSVADPTHYMSCDALFLDGMEDAGTLF